MVVHVPPAQLRSNKQRKNSFERIVRKIGRQAIGPLNSRCDRFRHAWSEEEEVKQGVGSENRFMSDSVTERQDRRGNAPTSHVVTRSPKVA